MTEPMTPERFAELAEAYGAIARWPADARDAGRTLAEARPHLAALLAEAEALDARLARWRIDAPSAALQGAILAQRGHMARRRMRIWWSGLGIATALAGATAGSFAAAATLPPEHVLSDDATVFGNVPAQED
ncbi:hypothetical protein [Flavisphingomonas formosensis]|uniref:hypothetical protein n=1 Tax=Flavisphingomonas formosensis TaxID=861534 RepID=UPI0012FC01E1|nr:hypothetical protein [Sphingomonas formosensis]